MRLSPAQLAADLAPEDPDMKTSFQIVQLADFFASNRMTITIGVLAQLLRHNGVDVGPPLDDAPMVTLVKRAYEWVKGAGLPTQARNVHMAVVTEEGLRLPLSGKRRT